MYDFNLRNFKVWIHAYCHYLHRPEHWDYNRQGDYKELEREPITCLHAHKKQGQYYTKRNTHVVNNLQELLQFYCNPINGPRVMVYYDMKRILLQFKSLSSSSVRLYKIVFCDI